MTSRWWPLFDLELTSARLVLKCTRDDHFDGLFEAMHEGVHPPGVESASFPPTRLTGAELETFAAQSWWRNRSGWKPEDWWLDLTVFERSEPAVPIGMQTIAGGDFPTRREISTASWLARSSQRRGLGREMRAAALHFAFGSLEAISAVSEAFPENIASQRVSEACGYLPDGVEIVDSTGGSFTLQRYRLPRTGWVGQSEEVAVHGFESCAHLFGHDSSVP